MTCNEYLYRLAYDQNVPDHVKDMLRNYRERIENMISGLEGSPRFYYAGSYGKRTMIRQRYDLDIVVYWPHDANYTIKGIYEAVGDQLKQYYKVVNAKTVCWEIPFEGGFHIDVVPGRAIGPDFLEANLYRTDTGTTLKTSVKKHIEVVRGSNRNNAIRLMKLWRELKKVPFKKSFLLEMMTIIGCKDCSYTDLEQQVISALKYIYENIESAQIKDPANSNNSLSDDISPLSKSLIKEHARLALNTTYWADVFSTRL